MITVHQVQAEKQTLNKCKMLKLIYAKKLSIS